MQVFEIDENGYFIRDVELKLDEELPNNCIEIQPPQGLYKARWSGAEWIEEGAPPEPQQQPPTQEELLEQRINDLELYILMQEGLI